MEQAKFVATVNELGLELSEAQLEAFTHFEEALYAANDVMNLTRVPRDEAWLRHFVDCLLFQDLIPEGSSIVDFGTGPGLPAWPLACARPDLHMAALDSNRKMLGFLRTQPLPNLKVLEVRAEEWGIREKYDAATGRAVAPLGVQLEISAPVLKVGGLMVPMRTPNDREAIDSLDPHGLGLELESAVERELPGTDVVRLFPIYRKIKSTPKKYPRSWADIKRKPYGS